MQTKLLFILLLLYDFAVSQGTWTKKNNFSGGLRGGAIGFSIGNKGYVGTGQSWPNIAYNDFWEYEPSNDTWTQVANFPGINRSGAVGFSINLNGYVGTGHDTNSTYLKDFWEYNPIGNSWTKKADFPDSARASAVGFSINSKGYIGTGKNDSLYFSDFWEYDPTLDSWSKKADFPGQARSSASGFSINLKGYIGLGSIWSPFYNDFWEYDPSMDNWTQKTSFPGPSRAGAAGFSIGNSGYICAGGTSPVWPYEKFNDLWEYNPALDIWEQKASFGSYNGRYGAFGFSIDSCAYIGTGSFSGFDPPTYHFNDVWAYCFFSYSVTMEFQDSGFNFQIFPNPNNGNMYLKYHIDNTDKAVINIYDVNGKLLLKQMLMPENNLLEINNFTFRNGIYYYSITVNDETSINKKFAVIK